MNTEDTNKALMHLASSGEGTVPDVLMSCWREYLQDEEMYLTLEQVTATHAREQAQAMAEELFSHAAANNVKLPPRFMAKIIGQLTKHGYDKELEGLEAAALLNGWWTSPHPRGLQDASTSTRLHRHRR